MKDTELWDKRYISVWTCTYSSTGKFSQEDSRDESYGKNDLDGSAVSIVVVSSEAVLAFISGWQVHSNSDSVSDLLSLDLCQVQKSSFQLMECSLEVDEKFSESS